MYWCLLFTVVWFFGLQIEAREEHMLPLYMSSSSSRSLSWFPSRREVLAEQPEGRLKFPGTGTRVALCRIAPFCLSTQYPPRPACFRYFLNFYCFLLLSLPWQYCTFHGPLLAGWWLNFKTTRWMGDSVDDKKLGQWKLWKALLRSQSSPFLAR